MNTDVLKFFAGCTSIYVFDPDDEDEIEEDEMLETLKCTVAEMTVFFKQSSILSEFDAVLAAALKTLDPKLLLKIDTYFKDEEFTVDSTLLKANEVLSHVFDHCSTEEKLQRLYGAVLNDNVTIFLYLSKLLDFHVVGTDGHEVSFSRKSIAAKEQGGDDDDKDDNDDEDEDDNDDEDDDDDDDDDDEQKEAKMDLPLMYHAVKSGSDKLIPLLVSQGADVNVEATCPEQYEKSPFQYVSCSLLFLSYI
jgi:hypothetical protein